MLTFTIRRLVLAVPTLLFISLVIFMLLEFAPGDPMAQVPLTVPPEVKGGWTDLHFVTDFHVTDVLR